MLGICIIISGTFFLCLCCLFVHALSFFFCFSFSLKSVKEFSSSVFKVSSLTIHVKRYRDIPKHLVSSMLYHHHPLYFQYFQSLLLFVFANSVRIVILSIFNFKIIMKNIVLHIQQLIYV